MDDKLLKRMYDDCPLTGTCARCEWGHKYWEDHEKRCPYRERVIRIPLCNFETFKELKRAMVIEKLERL